MNADARGWINWNALPAWVTVSVALAALSVSASTFADQPPAPLVNLREVPFTQVRIADAFWAPRRETNRKVSLQHALKMLDDTGAIANFDVAAKILAGGPRDPESFKGLVFTDSDLYKTLESVAYSLATDPDPALDAQLDGIIARMAAAQMPDGYLNTYYQIKSPDKRFSNLRDHHELYCAGHLFEAAVAHFQATGKRNLLDIARKYADCIERTFGPSPKRPGYCGHPEIELALVKLSRATGEQRYFDLAKFFLDSRGSHFFATEHNTPEDKYDGEYWQDNCPIRDHDKVVGHAVRAGYLMSATVDVGAQTNDAGMLAMVDRVWRNATERNMYVTGGIGPSAHNEGFTFDYDLPNRSAYQETCASVAMAMWNHRLNLAYGDAKYADLVELALYNGALDGVSLDGTRFFYVNPLESTGTHHRSAWYACACCPPNVTRTLAALGNYAYATSSDALWINLYIAGGVKARVAEHDVALDVKTDYPWDGRVEFTFADAATTGLRLRIPGWCDSVNIAINGVGVGNPRTERDYLVIDSRAWNKGDRVQVDMSMPVRRIEANPRVDADHGLLAMARGPLIYCIEGMDIDVPPTSFWSFAIAPDAKIEHSRRNDLFGGITVLTGEGSIAGESEWPHATNLYRTASQQRRVKFTAIPYCYWDNREACPMRVWMPTTPAPPRIVGPESKAKVTLSYTSDICYPDGIKDGIEPRNSGDHPGNLCHWWPHKGGINGAKDEWVQYTWDKPLEIGGVSVYWFDDTGKGECRLPKSWRVMYREGAGDWKPVQIDGDYPIALDKPCEVMFAHLIKATDLRLEFQLQDKWSVGIHEWKVVAREQ